LKLKDSIITKKDGALRNQTIKFKADLAKAVKNAGVDAVEAYKTSNEFQGIGLEYLDRGIKMAY